MRHEPAQVQAGLRFRARAGGVGLGLADEVPLSAVFIVPVVAHGAGFLFDEALALLGLLEGEGGGLVVGVVLGPQEVQRDWGADQAERKRGF